MIVAESAIGRMTRKSPVGAFQSFGKSKWLSAGGWINAIIPILIVPYYSVIGGWVIKYLIEYVKGNSTLLAEDGYFSGFPQSSVLPFSALLRSPSSTPVCETALNAFPR